MHRDPKTEPCRGPDRLGTPGVRGPVQDQDPLGTQSCRRPDQRPHIPWVLDLVQDEHDPPATRHCPSCGKHRRGLLDYGQEALGRLGIGHPSQDFRLDHAHLRPLLLQRAGDPVFLPAGSGGEESEPKGMASAEHRLHDPMPLDQNEPLPLPTPATSQSSQKLLLSTAQPFQSGSGWPWIVGLRAGLRL